VGVKIMKLFYGVLVICGVLVVVGILFAFWQPSAEVWNIFVIVVSIVVTFLGLAYYEKRQEQVKSNIGEEKLNCYQWKKELHY
jgi:uncharacterized membrane protein YbhN (UPF0104 family)